jgi:hypothetical protein
MPVTPPTLKLTRVSSTAFNALLGFSQNLSAQLFLRSAEYPGIHYAYNTTLLQPGQIVIAGRDPFSFQQAFAVTRDAAGSLSLPAFAEVDLNAPDSILSAVKSKWYSTPSLVSRFPGGMFANEAPESINKRSLEMPYVIVRDSDRDFTFTTENTYFEGTRLEIVCFAPGAFLVDECIDTIRTAFDWKTLVFQKNTVKTVSMQPTSQEIRSENFRYKDGNLIFRGSVMYDIIVTRIL